MHDTVVTRQQTRLAIIERIACHTVGIAVNANTGIGTGTLVACDADKFVLTAHHVIADAKSSEIRFWCRPSASIVPIQEQIVDAEADVAVLQLNPNFAPPEPSVYYDLRESRPFAAWPEAKLEGISRFFFGFPVENARPVRAFGVAGPFLFLGTAHGVCDYDSDREYGLACPPPFRASVISSSTTNQEPLISVRKASVAAVSGWVHREPKMWSGDLTRC
jgi:hypothetical protein